MLLIFIKNIYYDIIKHFIKTKIITVLWRDLLIMDVFRFIQIFVVQGIFALVFLYLAYQILKRGRKRLNLYLSGFYLCITIGGFLNIIYANIFDSTTVYVLHFITYYFYSFSLVFLLIFELILSEPIKQITNKTQ